MPADGELPEVHHPGRGAEVHRLRAARVPKAGLSLHLSELMQQLATDMTADLDGIGSASQVQKDGNLLIAACARYGVDS
jgi:hypothetical protein